MKKKAVTCLATAVLLASLFIGVLLPGMNAYAYDIQYAREGVVPVVFALTDDVRYVVYDTESGEIIKTLEKLGDNTLWSHGSGFFIGAPGENPQYVVTNAHVVDDYAKHDEGGFYLYPRTYYKEESYGTRYIECYAAVSCEMRVYYSENEYEVAYLEACGDRNKVDLAVLRLRNPTDKRHALVLEMPTESMVGTENVSTIGYPGNADNELTSASKFGINDSTVHNGTINRLVANDKGVERIAVDATIQHGNSGGPLVSQRGTVLGVNSNIFTSLKDYGTTYEEDGYAISTSELVRFLDKNSIPYQMDTDESSNAATENGEADAEPEEESSPAPTPEVSEPEPVSTPAPEPAPAPAGNSGSGMMPIIIVLLIAAAIVAAVVFTKKKKPKASDVGATQAASTPAPAPVPQKKAMLRSMSVQHNGMTFALHSTPIMIGRDPATCKVVFKEGTEGVSGRHCSVSFDEASGDFVLTDLRSTYGTYLMNGQKLNANVPYHLKAGDGFYAGDKANAFRVELG